MTTRPGEHFYEPHLGHRLPHDPFKAIIAPRPIGWISTIDAIGRANLAPYSFFNALGDNPPVIGFSSYGRKDTQANVEETGEFVYNLATRDLAEQMNRSSAGLPHEQSEFEFAGLAMAPSQIVKPPRVATTPAALECKVLQIIPIDDLQGRRSPNTLILGQVVGVHIDPAFLTDDGLFDMTRARTIARCGYAQDYAEISELFAMPRPGSR